VAGVSVFPAAVELPDGTVVQPAKVDTVDGVVRVWALIDRRPGLVATIDADLLAPPVDTSERWLTVKGRALHVRHVGPDVKIAKAAGCGCSHPMKRFRPPTTTPAGALHEIYVLDDALYDIIDGADA
jgi:hypothetical protein